jgi:integrase
MSDDLKGKATSLAAHRPWNKGKLNGPKPPLQPKHVWAIRTRLQMQGRMRDLALFNLDIDSKLRGCDVVRLKVEDIAPNGYPIERASVRQKKTGRPVRFEITEQARLSLDEYLRDAKRERHDTVRGPWPRAEPHHPPICEAGLDLGVNDRA